ncbi:hypothetical protein AAY473_013514 [Plecturocebus cupreus]
MKSLKANGKIERICPGSLITPGGLTLLPRLLECSGVMMAHYSLDLLGSGDPLTSASQVAGTMVVCHDT